METLTQEKGKLEIRGLPTWLMMDFLQRALDVANRFFPEPPPANEKVFATWDRVPRVRIIPGVDHIRLEIDREAVIVAHLGSTDRWLLHVQCDLFDGEAVKMLPTDSQELRMIAERNIRLGLPQ